jgi:hypothetical protein
MRTLFERRRYFDAIFIRNLRNGFITYPSLLEDLGVRSPARHIRDFNTFPTSFLHNKYPSVRCSLAANEVINNVNMFTNHFFNINFPTSLLIGIRRVLLI